MLDTKILFLKLLRLIQPDNVLDIGSRDAREAVAFHACLPRASIYAFEANPALFDRIQADENVARAGVHVVNKAASSESGTIRFRISDGDYDNTTNDDLAGTSSIKERPDFDYKAVIDVEASTLDEYFQDTGGDFALWIDVEGATFEVIEGATALLSRVRLIHAEVETRAIWRDQRTKDEVIDLLSGHGFVLLWDNLGTAEQGDIVLIRRDEPYMLKLKAHMAVTSAWILSWLSRSVRGVRIFPENSAGYRFLKSIKDRLT